MINIIIYHQYHITIIYYHKLSHFHEHFHLALEGRQEGKLCDPHWFLEIMRKMILIKLFSKYRLSFRRAMSFDILSPSRGLVRCNGRHFEESSEPSSSSKPKSWWGNTSLTWMYLQLAALVRITQQVQYCVALVLCRDKGKHVTYVLLAHKVFQLYRFALAAAKNLSMPYFAVCDISVFVLSRSPSMICNREASKSWPVDLSWTQWAAVTAHFPPIWKYQNM